MASPTLLNLRKALLVTRPNQYQDQQDLLARLCIYLRDQFQCETAILYGSRSRGDWDPASDIDVLALTGGVETGHVAHRWADFFLDLFLYPPNTKPDQDWLRIYDGRVLFQHDMEGDKLLSDVSDMFLSGPKLLAQNDLKTTRLWLEKMLLRAEKGDPEGNYRRHWLLKDALEIYFVLRGRWYLGPKKSLVLMRDDNPAQYRIFERALAPAPRHSSYDRYCEWAFVEPAAGKVSKADAYCCAPLRHGWA